ncbi:MAG: glycoside hydrolase family 88 protein [Odoribacter sp.]|nr:glycoside hydrolase family 88 protein [Odoribacter sp.]
MKIRIFLLVLFIGLVYSCKNSQETSLIKKVNETLDFSVEQSLRMAESLKDQPGRLPVTFENDELKTASSAWWTSGFFPGTLWYLYEYTNDPVLREWATEYTERVRDQQYTTNNHDVGFMIFCSFGNGYRVTEDTAYLRVIHQASKSLITRYNPVVGCIKSWESRKWQFPVIIDNMMNLEMLMWSGKKFVNDTFVDIANQHAEVTMKHHFREDNSSYHVVSYDTITGQPECKETAQGYAHESAWARGQAWGLYGYTMMYRESGNPAFLEQAQKIADFILNHPNLPEDKIPYWDFNAPDIPNTKRDVSAGAIICSALLELSQYVPEEKGSHYLDIAEEQLEVLCSPAYLADAGENGNFILMHSVGNMPHPSEVDVPLTYADYYFVEAMMRYKKMMSVQ